MDSNKAQHDWRVSHSKSHVLLAIDMIRGVGIWHLDTLEYGDEGSAAAREADDMWEALSVFTQTEDDKSRKV